MYTMRHFMHLNRRRSLWTWAEASNNTPMQFRSLWLPSTSRIIAFYLVNPMTAGSRDLTLGLPKPPWAPRPPSPGAPKPPWPPSGPPVPKGAPPSRAQICLLKCRGHGTDSNPTLWLSGSVREARGGVRLSAKSSPGPRQTLTV